MFPEGINERGMERFYTFPDLTPGIIQGYRRDLSAKLGGWSFYGLSEDTESFVSGTFLEISSLKDQKALFEDERVGEVYRVSLLPPETTSIGRPALTLVSLQNAEDTKPYPGYIDYVWRGIQRWGDHFCSRFLETGGVEGSHA